MKDHLSTLPHDYIQAFESIKNRIYETRAKVVKSINKEQTQFYWDIGKILHLKLQNETWGKGVVKRMSQDLQLEFPEMKGINPSDLWRARSFYEQYKDNEKLGQLARELPFNHNLRIFERIEDIKAREFYLTMAVQNFWSRSELENRIKDNDYLNFSSNQNNYLQTLTHLTPEVQKQISWNFKDDVDLGLIESALPIKEKILEEAVVKNIVRLLSDMGRDFLFAGRQYKVMINDKEFFIDLLFYHRKLKCFVVVELKAEEFKFDHMGQIQGYLACIDNLVKYDDENPSIGIIICKSKNKTMVEFALQNTKVPVGVATYSYKTLPEQIAKYLPSEQDIIESVEGFEE
jgi:predicted nuclease of restriction endonuclease-like (RecB) superfamily